MSKNRVSISVYHAPVAGTPKLVRSRECSKSKGLSTARSLAKSLLPPYHPNFGLCVVLVRDYKGIVVGGHKSWSDGQVAPLEAASV